jgi:hypothetical protein
MRSSRAITLVTLFIIIGCVAIPACGQRRGASRTQPRARTVSQPSGTRGGAATETGNDKYWAAQRSIESAIQQLEAYLREAHDGERAATARQQLELLRSLAVNASRPEWVSMKRGLHSRDVPQWRIALVEPQAERTRVTVEVMCTRDDGGDCYLYPFDRFPLVLVDNSGRHYPMLEAVSLPPGVSYNDRERRASISGGRTITVSVDFAPLANNTVSGQVYYRDDNEALPARFSLTRRR